jgi:hypothetical protein
VNGKVVVGALLATVLSVAAAEARGPYGSINVGNWKGGAFTSDQSGAFSHCVAGATYDSGIYFMVMIDQGGGGRWASSIRSGVLPTIKHSRSP